MNGRHAKDVHRVARQLRMGAIVGNLNAVVAVLNRGFWGRIKWLLFGR